jgi:uncharacterized protein (DUF4213/DUF364 family)
MTFEQTPANGSSRTAIGARSATRRAINLPQAGWIRPGVVVHDPAETADGVLAGFALGLRARGFSVVGYVQHLDDEPAADRAAAAIDHLDLATSTSRRAEPAAATAYLETAMREGADLLVIGRFSACTDATDVVRPRIGHGDGKELPMLTAIAGESIHQWHSYVRQDGAMIAPDLSSLWHWWGPERLYRDLTLGVAADEVRQLACGPRWIMVEGPHGAGLAYLPRHPRALQPRLPQLAKLGLRGLAELSSSWDPLETALGIAAINAHYNRFDLQARPGNGVKAFRNVAGRVGVIGAFPGVDGMLPNCAVMETDPRPGEFPLAAMDTLLPACGAAVVNSSALINRTLPRILRLARNRPIALIGPTTPMTSRLFDYGVTVLGGLIVTDPAGLGTAIRAGALPREFTRFGQFSHITKTGGSLRGATTDCDRSDQQQAS